MNVDATPDKRGEYLSSEIFRTSYGVFPYAANALEKLDLMSALLVHQSSPVSTALPTTDSPEFFP